MNLSLRTRHGIEPAQEDGCFVVSEEDLPVVLLSPDPVEPDGEIIGTWKTDDWPNRWFWNPFAEPRDKDGRWWGRLSYGVVRQSLRIGEAAHHVALRVVPSVGDRLAIQAMRTSLAHVEETLTRGHGRTRQAVRTIARRPRSGEEALEQYLRNVSCTLPALTAIARRPLEGFSPHDCHRTIDVPDNRILLGIVRGWQRDLIDIADLATAAASNVESLVNGVVRHATQRLPKGWTTTRRREQAAFQDAAERARTLAEQLQRAVHSLRHLRPARHLLPTPRMRLDHRYDHVSRQALRLRAEVTVGKGGHVASLPDARASFLYEFWAALELAHCLVGNGWRAGPAPWVAGLDARRFQVELSKDADWTFTREDGASLRVSYEPTLRPIRSPNRKPPAGVSTRDWALRKLHRDNEQLAPGLYTCVGNVTPDIVLRLALPDGRRCLAVGDMVYARCRLGDCADSPAPDARARWGGLNRKNETVSRLYASKVFEVADAPSGTSILPASRRSGFVVYPGSARTEHLVEDADLQPLRLRPGAAEAAARVRAVRRLVQAMTTLATEPRPLSALVQAARVP